MFDIFSKFKDKIVRSIEIRLRLVQLGFIERTASILSYFIFTIILLFILFGILLFLGLGLAEFFTSLVDSRVGGFFLAGACYILLTLVFYALRKNIIRIIANIFVRLLTEDNRSDDKENVDDNE